MTAHTKPAGGGLEEYNPFADQPKPQPVPTQQPPPYAAPAPAPVRFTRHSSFKTMIELNILF